MLPAFRPRVFVTAILAAGMAVAARPAEPQQFVVVTHRDNAITSIERDDLSRIFLKRIARWRDGKPAQPVDLAAGQNTRVAFTSVVHRKSVNAVRAFWQQQIFSGRDVPPPEKTSDRDVLAFIMENPGAVGYVSSATSLGDGVKIITILGFSP